MAIFATCLIFTFCDFERAVLNCDLKDVESVSVAFGELAREIPADQLRNRQKFVHRRSVVAPRRDVQRTALLKNVGIWDSLRRPVFKKQADGQALQFSNQNLDRSLDRFFLGAVLQTGKQNRTADRFFSRKKSCLKTCLKFCHLTLFCFPVRNTARKKDLSRFLTKISKTCPSAFF